MATPSDLLELSKHLKQERLFITSEREQLHHLNENVSRSSERLFHLSWLARQQRSILQQLILGCKQVTPEKCFQQNNALETVKFIDAYKHLSYHESKVGEFFKFLRDNPKLVALILLDAEKNGTEYLQRMAQVIMAGLYGDAIMPEDETNVLQVLRHLIELQVALNDNPRRLLRRQSCAFSIVFRLLSEGMFSAKLFLTAALHKPVMQLLMDVEWFYDIDPDRTFSRFPHKEQLRRFGTPGSKEYTRKCRHYREQMVNKLVTLAEHFLTSIKNNMYCFPQSLAWIVHNLYQTVTKAQRIEPPEVRAICADLVLTLFICPAICDPEPFGITSDAPISYITRHNLMQVAQILQVLAMDNNPEDGDPKTKDLYLRFERGCMSFLLDLLLESPASTQPPLQTDMLTGGCRAAVMLTATELADLVSLVKSFMAGVTDNSSTEHKQLDQILQQLPPASSLQHGPTSSRSNTPTGTPQPTPPGTPSSIQKLKSGLRDKRRLFLSPEPMAAVAPDPQDDVDSDALVPPEDVLVVSLGISNECPGLMSEEKVMEQESKPRKFNSLIPGEDDPISESDIPLHEKRTRFSLSHDQDSIATSDNLEAISEAASSHSVGSDLDDNENDNLSDMVSANVSGRGTPNISGRDTPISLAGSQAGRPDESGAPNLPVIIQKNNREDVTDRFGKFDIKQELERDETKSTVSDTWSTDVLASDSEPPEQTQYERLSEVAEEMARQNLLGVVEVSELSETTSDAWSMDVLASDTSERQIDRLLELDQDDMCSISSRSQAQDESSEVGDIGETGEDTPQPSEPHSPGFGDKLPDSSGQSSRPHLAGASRAGATGGSLDFLTGGGGGNNSNLHRDQRDRDVRRKTDRYSEPPRGSDFSGGILKNGEDDQKPLIGGYDAFYADGAQGDGYDVFCTVKRNNKSSSGGAIPRNYSGDSFPRSSDSSSNRSTSPFTGEPTAFTSPVTSKSQVYKAGNSSVDALSANLQDGLKISEQQNVKIDASRLSAVLDIFDPLSGETNAINPDSSDGKGASAFLDSEPPEKIYNHLGTRPKVSSADYTNMPRIAFIEASLDEGQSIDSRPLSSQVRSNGKYALMEPGIEPLPDSNHGYRGSGDSIGLGKAPQGEVKATEDTKDSDDKRHDGKKKAGLLHIFKEKWHKGSGKRKVKDKEESDNSPRAHGRGDDSGSRPSSEYSRLSNISNDDPFPPPTDTTDDILDKYRLHNSSSTSSPSKPTNENSTSTFSSGPLGAAASQSKGVSWDNDDDGSQSCDSAYESRKAFSDAKKKLRLVLSTADFQVMPNLSGCYGNNNLFRTHGNKKDNDLVSFLRIQLAEAINLQDKDLVAQLHETIRCLTPFDNSEIKKLLRTMRDEYRTRSPYISYLVRCRQGLLSTLSHLDRLLNRVQRNKMVSNKYFISVLVRLFLENREKECNKFVADFKQLTMPDEKTDLVEQFLDSLNRQVERDVVWKAANAQQIEEAKLCIEWNVMSSIYVDAMYPNADGDIYRDQILHDNIQKLSAVITPGHKELCIPRIYHYECPWPAAQAEIYMINAYKTPRDKVQCVERCSMTIMNLLSMASDKSVPAADDFMPVIIYVIIKANPPSLLSTVQYVNSFYQKRMGGETEYWWSQFCSAIEYIKMMIMRNDEGSSSA